MIQKRPAHKRNGAVNDLNRSDAIWAAVSILSFPIVALSLAALGWHSVTSFIMACLAMIGILLIEALASGRVWIFNPQYRHIFDHQDTPFRILVVAGGVLLLLETFLIIQFLQNPSMDDFYLNIIARKQCANPTSATASALCPLFQRRFAPQQRDDFGLLYSLQDAAHKHLMPTSIAGSCSIVPLSEIRPDADMTTLTFFAYCRNWNDMGCSSSGPAASAFITASIQRTKSGFYTPLTWQEDRQSANYTHLMANQDFLDYLDQDLAQRCSDWHGRPIMPSDLKP